MGGGGVVPAVVPHVYGAAAIGYACVTFSNRTGQEVAAQILKPPKYILFTTKNS
jgi:hypothetical protein